MQHAMVVHIKSHTMSDLHCVSDATLQSKPQLLQAEWCQFRCKHIPGVQQQRYVLRAPVCKRLAVVTCIHAGQQ